MHIWRQKKSTEQLIAHRLPLNHTHNRLDRKFGTAAQSTRGRSGVRARAGCGAHSQQEFNRKVVMAISDCHVEVHGTFAVYDAESYYKPHVDANLTGYGPGTPMRVIKIFRGAPTAECHDVEPRMMYKLAAQYESLYPTDCPEGDSNLDLITT